MKLQVVSNFDLANNEATSCFRAQTSLELSYKLILIFNHWKQSYKLLSTSNESGIKLQVDFNFNRVNNEATSCFQAQTSQEWYYKLFSGSNELRMKLQVDSKFKQPKMNLQVVLKFKRVWNEATSCFQLQSSQ